MSAFRRSLDQILPPIELSRTKARSIARPRPIDLSASARRAALARSLASLKHFVYRERVTIGPTSIIRLIRGDEFVSAHPNSRPRRDRRAETTAAASPRRRAKSRATLGRVGQVAFGGSRSRGCFGTRNHALGPGAAGSLVHSFPQHPSQRLRRFSNRGPGYVAGEPAPAPDTASPFRRTSYNSHRDALFYGHPDTRSVRFIDHSAFRCRNDAGF